MNVNINKALKFFILLYKSNINRLGSLFILIAIIFSSCSPVKKVPDDEFLLDRYKIKVREGKVKKDEIKNYVRQKPNKRILGIRFHLWLYNLSKEDKDKGLSNWFKTIGEEPVIYDEYLSNKSIDLLKSYFDNKGYYNSTVKDTVQLKRKRARILYKVEINDPYKIKRINYTCNDTGLVPDVMPDTINSRINKGDNFDLDLLEDERQRIETNLKNKGYYRFNKDFIFFQADSLAKSLEVDLLMNIHKFQKKGPGNTIIKTSHKKYVINKVYVFINFDQKEALSLGENYYNDLDTTYIDGIYFISKGIDNLNKRVVIQSNFIQVGKQYSLYNANKTYKHLNSLRLFKIINIQFNTIDSLENDSLNLGYLDCNIQLSKHLLQSYTIELQGTNSYGNIGVGGNLLYRHRSLFGGAEITDFRINGAIESITDTIASGNSYTTEFGGNITVSIPKFILPVFKAEKFSKKYSPKTQIFAGYNFMDRIDYRRTIANMSYGYIWDGNRFLKHSVKLLELNAVKLPYATQEFKDYIDSTNLRSSYDDHLVSVTSYSLVFNNQDIKKRRDFYFFILNTEISGNILFGISELTNASKDENGSYTILGVPFSQYAKFDIDFRYYDVTTHSNTLAYRFFGGIGIPYGNSESLPFEKMYFSGGANSIRAWSVKDLGPGSYTGGSGTRFPNQTGDIKLEANIEYRFKLFWVLEGALFIDAGNVWNLNSDKLEGGMFRMNEFYKEFAIGSGVGTRFDFSFLLFRLDFGVKLRDPALPDGERWILGNRNLTWQDDVIVNIGIGYPF
ncbi:MAG: outer membrane protein assembly factor [Bacteroidales bacterium]|nr:outer membrane protein assembly factor [Bacteroidales bacterium]